MACGDPPEKPPGLTITQDPIDSQLFFIRLSGYSTFGGDGGVQHFCTCGLDLDRFIQGFAQLTVVDAQLVEAGTNTTYMTFDFDPNSNSSMGWNDLTESLEWQGLLATVNDVIPSGIGVDFVFSLRVEFIKAIAESQIGGIGIAEIEAALNQVGTAGANPDGSPNTNDPDHLAIYDIAALLPVELTSFGADLRSEMVILNWQTSSEQNNAGFEVQHRNGGEFVQLGFVTGQGTTTESSVYSFEVDELQPGYHEFRLKQLDFDGTATFSSVVGVEIDVPGNYVVYEPYPNPFVSHTEINFAVASDQEVEVGLFDVLGKQVLSEHRRARAGSTERVVLNASNLPSGVYLLHLRGGDFEKSYTVNLVK